jgi:hypothetical protein
MGTDLIVSNRAGLAAYAGLAVSPRHKRIATIAAVDILAIALAFGALHVTGAMMGGAKLPAIIPPVSAAEPSATDTPLVPLPRSAPARVAVAVAAEPDLKVIFAPPDMIAQGFTFGEASPASSRFSPPPGEVASADPGADAPSPVTPVPTPRLRPVERIAQTVTPVIDAADGSLDRLVLRDVVPVVGGVGDTVAAIRPVTTTVSGTLTQVASVAPVSTVTQVVASPVQQVVRTVGGLLN